MADMDTATLEALLAEVTPGTWGVSLSLSGLPYQIVAPNADDKAPGKVGRSITRWASITLPSSAEGQANARLIAMAPDLARHALALAADNKRLREALNIAGPIALKDFANHPFILNDEEERKVAVIRAALQSEVSHG